MFQWIKSLFTDGQPTSKYRLVKLTRAGGTASYQIQGDYDGVWINIDKDFLSKKEAEDYLTYLRGKEVIKVEVINA